jgi:hypothetical protein
MGRIPGACTGRSGIRNQLRMAVQEEETMTGRLSYDVAVTAVVLFTFALVFVLATFTYNQVANNMINNSIVNQSNATVTVLQAGKTTINKLDYIFFTLFIGLMLSIIIASFFIPANSIFAFIYFIGLVVIVATASILSYVFGKITENGYFNNIATANLPITSHLMSNLALYITIVGFVAMVLLYAKPQQMY